MNHRRKRTALLRTHVAAIHYVCTTDIYFSKERHNKKQKKKNVQQPKREKWYVCNVANEREIRLSSLK